MAVSAARRRAAYVDKARAELETLARAGVVMTGNAFAPVLLAKGDVTATELDAGLLAGADGVALRAALAALGYAPEAWCGIATVRVADAGAGPRDAARLDGALMRTTVATLDPDTIIACDEAAANALRDAFADELAALPDLVAATLTAGVVVPVAGMRVLNLGGFAAALDEGMAAKQRAWAYLKQVPPLAEPY